MSYLYRVMLTEAQRAERRGLVVIAVPMTGCFRHGPVGRGARDLRFIRSKMRTPLRTAQRQNGRQTSYPPAVSFAPPHIAIAPSVRIGLLCG